MQTQPQMKSNSLSSPDFPVYHHNGSSLPAFLEETYRASFNFWPWKDPCPN